MSGFELEQRHASDKLANLQTVAERVHGEDLSRSLLNSLRQSSDIARDLGQLYSDRPYVYARIMQQLGKVLGKAKVRRLHNEITGRLKSEAARAERIGVHKKSLHAETKTGKNAPAGDKASDKTQEEDKEQTIHVKVPKLGWDICDLKINKDTKSFEASKFQGTKFFKVTNVNGSVSLADGNIPQLNTLTLDANFNAPHVKQASCQLTLTKSGDGYTPSGSFDADIDFPDLEGMKAHFSVSGGKDCEIRGSVNGNVQIFNKTVNTAANVETAVTENETNLTGALTVSNAGSSSGKQSGKSNTPIQFSGDVTLATTGGQLNGVTGNIKASNLTFLANPSEEIDLTVSYADGGFNAALNGSVQFSEHVLSGSNKKKGGGTSVQLTINSASYSGAELLCADCTATAKLGGIIETEGNIKISNNALQSGSLAVVGENVPLLRDSNMLTADFSGDVFVNGEGFEKGNLSGILHLNLGGKTGIDINLDSLNVSSDGSFDGSISAQEAQITSQLTIKTFKAEFSSTEGLTSVDGTLLLDTPTIKSPEDGGIDISYAKGMLAASGNLRLVRIASSAGGAGSNDGEDGESEIASCTFEAMLTESDISGTGNITLTSPYQIGQSQLQLESGCSANVTVTAGMLDPITFQGNYTYGKVGGGESGAGPQTQTPKKQNAKEGATSGQLQFEGQFQGNLDVETSMLNASADATLSNEYEFGSGNAKITLLPQSGKSKKNSTKTNLSAEIVNSEIATITGDIAAKANVKICNQDVELSGGLKGISVDVKNGQFTGTLSANLEKDVPVIPDEFMLKTSGTTINVIFNNNEITEIQASINADATVHDPCFDGGAATFNCKAKKVTLDVASGKFAPTEFNIIPKTNVGFSFHNDATKLTVGGGKKGSSLTLSYDGEKFTAVRGNVSYTGKTTVLGENPLDFSGKLDLDIQGLGDGAATVSGSASVSLNNEYEVVKDVANTLSLQPGTTFSFDLSNNEVEEISGNLKVRFQSAEGAAGAGLIKNGLDLSLEGQGLSYNVKNKKFNGDVSLKTNQDIELSLGTSNTFTICQTSSGLSATLTDNQLTSLTGSANFKANFALGKNKENTLNVTEGTTNVDIDVSTGAIHSMDIECSATCNMEFGKLKLAGENCQITAQLDSEGITNATFGAGLELNVGENFKCTITSDDLAYTRETGISGSPTVSIKERTKLGTIHPSNNNFEYGFGSQDNGPAVGITASIENNSLTKLNGHAGLYLEQIDGDGENALKLHGNIEFEVAMEGETPKLISASGLISIDEKELATMPNGDKLKLLKSEATIDIQGEESLEITGDINLGLNDVDSKKDYISFKVEGSLDALNTKSFNGTVKATVIGNKKLTRVNAKNFGEGAVYLCANVDGADSEFEATITNNQLTEFSGAVGVQLRYGETPYFEGAVSGSYKNAQLNGNATFNVVNDFPYPDKNKPKFAVCKGTTGAVSVTNNEPQNLDGTLVVKFAAPNASIDENYLEASASSQIDLKTGDIAHFEGQITSCNAFNVTENLTLNSVQGTVLIENNDFKSVSGSGSITYKMGDFAITGNIDTLGWQKGDDGDKFQFDGRVSISAMKGKLTGDANISYDSINGNGTPEISGNLTYKITEWLTAKVGVKFQDGWNDPVLNGEIIANNVELIPARQLLAFKKDLGTSIPIYPPVQGELGVGIGATLSMNAVTFSGNAKIEDFHLANTNAVPDFSIEIKSQTGLNLKASVAPYLGINVGVWQLAAGLRVRGKATATAEATANIGGEIKGSSEGFEGAVGLGFQLTGSASLELAPEAYAGLGDKSLTYAFPTWKMDLGEIFKFDWGKTFKFGDKGTSSEDTVDSKASLNPNTQNNTAVENKKGEGTGEFTAKNGKTSAGDKKPQLPSPETVAQDAGGKNVGNTAESLGGFGEKLQQIQEIANGLQAAGTAVGLLGKLIGSFISAGPAGMLLCIAAEILSGNLSFEKITNTINDIKTGFAALKKFIASNPDIFSDIMPEWLAKIINFFKGESAGSLAKKVAKLIAEKVSALGSPMSKILQPLVDYAMSQADKIGKLVKLFTGGISFENIMKSIFGLVGFAISSIGDLIKAGIGMLKNIYAVYQECVACGYIYITKDNRYAFKIPGLCNFSGKNFFIANGLRMIGVPKK